MARLWLCLALVTAFAGCTTVLARNAAPEEAVATARPYGIPGPFLRAWGDVVSDAAIERVVDAQADIVRLRYADEIATVVITLEEEERP